MTQQPDIALDRLGMWARLHAVSDLVQFTRSGPLALTAVLGHGVMFFSLPIILRIYGPESFGEYSLILSIGYVLLIVATLKLEVVIPTMQRVSLAARLTAALITLSLLTCLAVFPLGLALHSLTGWTPGHAIPAVTVFAILGVFVFLFSASLVLRNWLVRLQQLSGVAGMQIVRPLCFVILAIVFGYLWPESAPESGLALLLATGIALLATVLVGFSYVPKRLRKFTLPLRWRRNWQEVQANTRYLSAVSVSQILNLVSLQIPLWCTAALYGATPAGWVALSARIVFLPSMVVGASLGSVLNRRVSAAYHDEEQLAQKVSAFLVALGAAGMMGFGLIALAAPWLIDVVFGAKWQGAAPTLRLYSLYGFAYFLSATTAFIPILLQKKLYLIAQNAVRMGGLCGAALFAYVTSADFEVFIALLAGVEVCTYLYAVGYTVHIIHRYDSRLVKAEA